MAQDTNIGIKITLNGVSQAVGSIKEMEDALRVAREELNRLTVGSDAFKKLSGEIQVADGKLKDLKKSTEGISLEKKLSDFTKFGAGVTSAFAAATAAVNLFGGDTEKVSKAAAQAQNLLTIAIAARGVVEGVTAAKTVALTVATQAAIIANRGFIASLRLLWATMLANPITAILAVLGALIAAVVTYSAATDDATEKEEEYQRALTRTSAARQQELRLLQAQGASQETLANKRVTIALQEEEQAKKELVRLRRNGAEKEKIIAAEDKVLEAVSNRRIAVAERETLLREQSIKGEEERTKAATEASRKRQEELEKELQAVIKTIDLQIQRYKALKDTIDDLVPEPQVVKDSQELADQFEKTSEDAQNLTKSFSELVREVQNLPPPLDASIEDLDKFGVKLLNIRKVLTQAIFEGESIGDFADQARDELGGLLRRGEITQEAFKAGLGIVDAYEAIGDELQKTIRGKWTLEGVFEQFGGIDTYFDLLRTKLITEGKITRDIVRDENGKLIGTTDAQTGQSYTEAQNRYEAYVETVRGGLMELAKNDPAVIALRSSGASIEEIDAKIRELVDSQLNYIINIGNSVIGEEQKIVNFFDVLQKNQERRTKAAGDVTAKTILDNVDKITTELLNTTELSGDALEVAFDQQIQELLTFNGERLELTEGGNELILQAYQKFYENINKVRKDAEDQDKKGFEDFMSGITNNIEAFQSALTTLSQVTSDYYSMQLDMLERQNESAQDAIVGDTKEANEKRLEAERIYQEKRKQIEKEAARTSLRISLAQAIANAAASIVKITEQTGIFAPIAASIAAAANFASIAQISQQLNQLDSFQRGGFIKGQGGLVVGPSHEYGGVKYAQGGVELEGGEAVINRNSSVKYAGLLSEINQAGGGRPLVMNNFDDSRIVEALAKQRKEPLRAYVVERDITDAQQVNKRLESLAQI